MSDGKGISEGIAMQLGRFISSCSFEDIPADVNEVAKGRLLDILACCYAGRDLGSSNVVNNLARHSIGECTIVGRNTTSSILEAIMANAVAAHGTSQDDVMGGVAHPGSAVVPAALAIAENESSSGAELLAAIVLGYDLVWRVLRATGPISSTAFRPGTIFTAFGACAAAGKLMKINDVEMAHALGYTASLTPGCPNEGWWGGTMEPMLEIGMTARVGILSVIFARAGATSAPQVFEGRHGFFHCWSGTTENADQATKDLGRSFAITKTFIKPFAACGANQVPIQIASSLAKHKLKANDIVRIVEKLRPGATNYAGLDNKGPFSSPVQALMSMQFCAAAAILGRQINTPKLITNYYDDPEITGLASKVQLVTEQGRSAPRFEVYTSDSRMLISEEESPDRSIHIPTLAGMQDKFRRSASETLDSQTIEKIIHLITDLENLQKIGKLTRMLRR